MASEVWADKPGVLWQVVHPHTLILLSGKQEYPVLCLQPYYEAVVIEVTTSGTVSELQLSASTDPESHSEGSSNWALPPTWRLGSSSWLLTLGSWLQLGPAPAGKHIWRVN